MKFNDLISVLEGYKDTIKILGQIEVPIRIKSNGTEIYKTKEGFRYEYPNGNKEYYNNNNKLHRIDGPAVEWANNGYKAWYVNDQLHRTDGPAIEHGALEDGYKEWFVNDEQMSEKQFNAWRAKNNPVKESYKDTIKILGKMEVPIRINSNGTEVYKTKEGFRHEYPDGDIYYYNNTNNELHRIDGPAVEDVDGSKAWIVNGKRHRLDGPAIENVDGTKEWYVNDKYHRLDGPAIENADGGKSWFVNSKRHRTDGPAIEWANGSKSWFVNDKQMSEKQFNAWRAKNNPVKESYKDTIKILGKMEVPIRVDDDGTEIYITKEGFRYEYTSGSKAWFNTNNELHRTDGPAVEHADGTKVWWINNNLHRTDGPAIERANGNKSWYINGKRHRTDGPAIEHADGGKRWYINDKLHRTDGPAIEYVDGRKEWRVNGEQMSEEQFNAWRAKNNTIKESYKETIKILGKMEVPIRVDDDGTEIYITKEGFRYEYADGSKSWIHNGKPHRTDGPAVENSNGNKSWFVNGKRHRTDGPAIEWANGNKSWFINNELHRTDGPAIENADGGKRWFVNGERHRTDGPAIEHADGSKEWYINSIHMTEEQFNTWRAKNNPV